VLALAMDEAPPHAQILTRPVNGTPVPRLVVPQRGDAGAELDVAAQAEAARDVPQVAEDLRLGGVPLRPPPLGQQIAGKGVTVIDALDVTPGTGVAVPEPRAPDVGAALEDPCAQPKPAQPMEHVQSREPGAHHRYVKVHRGARATVHSGHDLPGDATVNANRPSSPTRHQPTRIGPFPEPYGRLSRAPAGVNAGPAAASPGGVQHRP
jgi:hypothetical protein